MQADECGRLGYIDESFRMVHGKHSWFRGRFWLLSSTLGIRSRVGRATRFNFNGNFHCLLPSTALIFAPLGLPGRHPGEPQARVVSFVMNGRAPNQQRHLAALHAALD